MTIDAPKGEREEALEPVCPFCGRDPFHYVDNGVGMEAMAVICCELGDMLFRGARETPSDVTLSWEEFTGLAARLLSSSKAEGEMREALAELVSVMDEAFPALAKSGLGPMERARRALTPKESGK